MVLCFDKDNKSNLTKYQKSCDFEILCYSSLNKTLQACKNISNMKCINISHAMGKLQTNKQKRTNWSSFIWLQHKCVNIALVDYFSTLSCFLSPYFCLLHIIIDMFIIYTTLYEIFQMSKKVIFLWKWTHHGIMICCNRKHSLG